MKNRLYLIAAILCYLAAIGFFISAIIGKNTVYIAVGVVWICLGTLDFVLTRIGNGNKK